MSGHAYLSVYGIFSRIHLNAAPAPAAADADADADADAGAGADSDAALDFLNARLAESSHGMCVSNA